MTNPIVEAFIKERKICVAAPPNYGEETLDLLRLSDVRALVAQLLPEGSVVVPRKPVVFALGCLDAAIERNNGTHPEHDYASTCSDMLHIALNPTTAPLPELLPKPGEQIAAEPKRTIGDAVKLARGDNKPPTVPVILTDQGPMVYAHCATPSPILDSEGAPSSVGEGKCVCDYLEIQSFSGKPMPPVCAEFKQNPDFPRSQLCSNPDCNHSRACHEVATPGTEKKGESDESFKA